MPSPCMTRTYPRIPADQAFFAPWLPRPTAGEARGEKCGGARLGPIGASVSRARIARCRHHAGAASRLLGIAARNFRLHNGLDELFGSYLRIPRKNPNWPPSPGSAQRRERTEWRPGEGGRGVVDWRWAGPCVTPLGPALRRDRAALAMGDVAHPHRRAGPAIFGVSNGVEIGQRSTRWPKPAPQQGWPSPRRLQRHWATRVHVGRIRQPRARES